MDPLLIWVLFAACSAVIAFAGYWLAKFGQIIAAKTGLGATVVGVVLVSSITSLPELVTGVSAVAVANAPNLAVGDALGSMAFNLLMLLVLEILHPQESIYTRTTQGHILSAGFGVMIVGFITLGILIDDSGPLIAIGHVGIITPILIVVYILALHLIYVYERHEAALGHLQVAEARPGTTLKEAIAGYAVTAVLVLGAGSVLPFLGAELSDAMGWNKSFVGTLFIALSTSLPELMVTASAAYMGALDMAIAGLLGSNLFDAVILAVDDLLYTDGPLLARVSDAHAATGVSTMIMTSAVIAALFYRPKERPLRTVGWTGLFLLVLYVMNAYLIFLHGE